jgi:hypothetical protein
LFFRLLIYASIFPLFCWLSRQKFFLKMKFFYSSSKVCEREKSQNILIWTPKDWNPKAICDKINHDKSICWMNNMRPNMLWEMWWKMSVICWNFSLYKRDEKYTAIDDDEGKWENNRIEFGDEMKSSCGCEKFFFGIRKKHENCEKCVEWNKKGISARQRNFQLIGIFFNFIWLLRSNF